MTLLTMPEMPTSLEFPDLVWILDLNIGKSGNVFKKSGISI